MLEQSAETTARREPRLTAAPTGGETRTVLNTRSIGPTTATRVPSRSVRPRVIVAAHLLGVSLHTAPAFARAPNAPKSLDEYPPVSTLGIPDPGARALPEMHRFRMALTADYSRLSATNAPDSGKRIRFHLAPVMLDLAYQLQFLRYVSVRAGASIGINAANSRHAMRFVARPRLLAGVQGKTIGFLVGYSLVLPFPLIANAQTEHPNTAPEPIIRKGQAIDAEVSLTSRIDRVSMTWSLGISALHSELTHRNRRNRKTWRPMFSVGFGFYIDKRLKELRQRQAERKAETEL